MTMNKEKKAKKDALGVLLNESSSRAKDDVILMDSDLDISENDTSSPDTESLGGGLPAASLTADCLDLPKIDFAFDESLQTDTVKNVLRYAIFEPITAVRLSWVLQNAPSFEHVSAYIKYYEPAFVSDIVNEEVSSVPVLFYAVARSCVGSIRLLVELGADINQRTAHGQIPLLAYAIMHGGTHWNMSAATDVVRVILALGVDHTTIPTGLYEPFINMPTELTSVVKKPVDICKASAWCSSGFRSKLANSINLTQRYLLARAATIGSQSQTSIEIARSFNISGIFDLPYYTIAQRNALENVQEALLNQFIDPDPKTRPLVLLFAGPSGHGKTEVARRMGNLLNVPLEIVDCSHMKHDTDIFGPKKPYQGWQSGSPLNKFLVDNANRWSVVFLDEFEKTTPEVHNSLLLPFDDGTYCDRTAAMESYVNCSKTIWILATNLFDAEILGFFDKHLAEKTVAQIAKAPYSALQKLMRAKLRQETRALSGRIMHIVPFFPFQPDEAAVLGHKYILSLSASLLAPIDQLTGRHIGRMGLNIVDDGALCKHITDSNYMRPDGARSVEAAMTREVKWPVFKTYRNAPYRSEEEINRGEMMRVRIELEADGEGGKSVGVRMK